MKKVRYSIDVIPPTRCEFEAYFDGVARKAEGVSNAKGFYDYTPATAKRWEKLFREFSYEIRALSMKYPEDAGDRPRRRQPR